MVTFQRARSEEQREVRRQTILETASAMLEEMPVAEVSLNELSRRVGLAKSNVLRYFESREAILLELLHSAWGQWLSELPRQLGAVDADAPAAQRGDQLAAALTSSLVGRGVLCDLMSAQAAVLERNLSAEVAASYKRSAVADVALLAEALRVFLPELDEGQAQRLGAATVMVISAVWTHAQPSGAMLQAYEADPSLAAFRLDFSEALTEILQTLIAGTLARARP